MKLATGVCYSRGISAFYPQLWIFFTGLHCIWNTDIYTIVIAIQVQRWFRIKTSEFLQASVYVFVVIFVALEHDTVNEAGNYSIADEYVVTDIGDSARLVAQRQRWDLNYREAAIYLQEGENNDKFSAHPSRQVLLYAI